MKILRIACQALCLLLLSAPSVYAQPKITSFTPSGAPAGASVTISGSGFNSSISGNTVLFGSVKGTVTAASATSLTVTVPAGTTNQPITVVDNVNYLSGSSTAQFVTRYSSLFGNNITAGSFQPRIDFAGSGRHPGAITFSDLDGDGKIDLSYLDIPSVLRDPSALYLSRNMTTPGSITTAAFGSPASLSPGQITADLKASDLNSDGKQDLLVNLALSARLSILRNVATPGTLDGGSFSGGGLLTGVSVSGTGDIDGDGRQDLISFAEDGTLAIYRNTSVQGNLSSATFAPAAKFPLGAISSSSFVGVTDLDGDGRPELILKSYQYTTDTMLVSVFRNTSTPGTIDASSFAARVDFLLRTASGFSSGVVVGDIDGDGKPDIVSSLYGSAPDTSRIAVLRNTSAAGTVSFAVQANFSAGASPSGLTLGDMNGDGKLDVVFVNSMSSVSLNTVSILFNTATAGLINAASFSGRINFPVPYAVRVGLQDIDADGKPDLIIYNDVNYQYNPFFTTFFSILKFRDQSTPPTITSFNPHSAPAGATVTITGTGFDPTPSNNIVYFGAVRATVSGSAINSLNVVVPPGATCQPVSVLNATNGFTAYAALPFLPAFTNPAGTGISSNFYKPKVDYASGAPAGTFPYSFAVGDIDGDGKSDMAVVHANSNSVTVLHNTSSAGNLNAASFEEKTSFATGSNPLAVVIQDVDGDGKPDLVVCNNGSSTISVLRNTAVAGSINAASFATKVDFPLPDGSGPYSMALGDINSDGRPDIVVPNAHLNTFSILPNNSTPNSITAASFGAPVNFYAGNFPRAVAVLDAGGDGKPEVVILNEVDRSLTLMYNTGTSSTITPDYFGASATQSLSSSAPSIAISDVNGDGKADLVLASYNTNTVSVLQNVSIAGFNGGAFEAPVTFATGMQPFSVAAGDADGDGKPDVVVANAGSNTLSVLRNISTGTGNITASSFAPAVSFAAGIYPIAAAIADLDGDGIAEAATANAGSSTVSLFKIAGSSASSTVPATAAQKSIQLYPNPTKGAFVLQLTAVKGMSVEVEVLNEAGKPIEKRSVNTPEEAATVTMQINLRNQPPGIYYVKTVSAGGVQIAKVVVQR